MLKKVLSYFLCLSAGLTTYAELQWETLLIRRKVAGFEEQTKDTFRFTNIGSEGVSIKSVKTSCGCVFLDSLDKNKIYLPGESGEIKLIFDIATRTGVQRKNVYVETTDGNLDHLQLEYIIGQPMAFSAMELLWEPNSEPIPKDIKALMRFRGKRSVKITNVRSDNPKFSVKLEYSPEEYSYYITVRPMDTSVEMEANIIVETDFKLGNSFLTYGLKSSVRNMFLDCDEMALLKNALFIDARARVFYDDGHIPDAVNIPVNELETKLSTVMDIVNTAVRKSQKIIVYCSNADCKDSHILAKKIIGLGANNVFVYGGGWEEYSQKADK